MFVEINKVLRIFSSLQFVLIDKLAIFNKINKQNQNKFHSPFSAMKVLPSLLIHASTSRLKKV